MSNELRDLSDKVRSHGSKMRELVKTLENGTLKEVADATEQLKAEIDALFATLNAVAGRRM